MNVKLDENVPPRAGAPGQHPGLVVLRPADQSSTPVERLLEAFLGQHQLDQIARCIVVVEPGAVRIRRPIEG